MRDFEFLTWLMNHTISWGFLLQKAFCFALDVAWEYSHISSLFVAVDSLPVPEVQIMKSGANSESGEGNSERGRGGWGGFISLGERWEAIVNISYCSTLWLHLMEAKLHVYVKRQPRICTTWSSFPSTCRLLFIISTHELVVSHNFLSIRIVWSCFYLLIFYFEIFSTWIWHLPFTWSLNSLIINLSCLPNVNQPFLINHSYWKQLRFAFRLSKSQFESVALFRDFVDQKSGLKGKTSLKRND